MSVAVFETQNTPNNKFDHLALDLVLPWHEQAEQQEKFERLIKRLMIPVFAFMVVMSILPNFFEEAVEEEKIIAQVILEKPKVVEIPPAPAQPLPEQKTQNVKKDAKPKEGIRTSLQNMAALSQQMSALQQSVNASKQQKKNIVVSDSGKVQQSSRSRLGQNNMNSTSGGLKASDVTVNAKGATLQGHQSDSVESAMMNIELPDAAQYHYDPKKNSQRDMQSIRPIIERAKGGIYALYTKALRLNPEMAGRFRFEFVILPNGSVADVKLLNSELADPKLEESILSKLKLMDFGVDDVTPTKIEYTYSFSPS